MVMVKDTQAGSLRKFVIENFRRVAHTGADPDFGVNFAEASCRCRILFAFALVFPTFFVTRGPNRAF